MYKYTSLVVLISFIVLICVWGPGLLNNNEPYKMTPTVHGLRKVPDEAFEGPIVGDELPETVPIKTRNIKVDITWIIATINGLLVTITMIKKILFK